MISETISNVGRTIPHIKFISWSVEFGNDGDQGLWNIVSGGTWKVRDTPPNYGALLSKTRNVSLVQKSQGQPSIDRRYRLGRTLCQSHHSYGSRNVFGV